jgi:hypothetical protein
MLGTLAIVEATSPPGSTTTGLQCGIVLGGFAAMAAWVRRNRAALDGQEWCECARTRIAVVRVNVEQHAANVALTCLKKTSRSVRRTSKAYQQLKAGRRARCRHHSRLGPSRVPTPIPRRGTALH